jgi:Ca-activated chloride channel homolog
MGTDFFDISPFSYDYTYRPAFWLFLLIPAIVGWYLYNESTVFKNINFSSLGNFEKKKFNFIAFFRHLNLFVLIIGLSFVILALARPYSPQDIAEFEKKNMEGIDIVIAIDVSTSMLAQDFKPDRLEAAKEISIDFIEMRPADRIGLVLFQGEAYTQAPLTHDHELLKSLFGQVRTGLVDDGTAIGEGIIMSVNRLNESDAKSKVIILLTDGVNNSGETDPLDAAVVAKENNICIYTIGVGKDGTAPYPVQTPFGTMLQDMPVEIDEELMTNISEFTGGNYYRAKDNTELEAIYEEIDVLERSKVKVLEYKTNPPEKYYGMLLFGILLVAIYRTVQHTFLKSIP